MKKIFLAFTTVLLFTSAIFATGTATISPSVAGAGSSGATFIISYADAGGVNWTNSGTSMGYLTVQIPSGWTAPTNGSGSSGNVMVYTVSSGNSMTVPANDISINGNTITITDNGLDISWYDTVNIVYGAGGGTEGVTVPVATGPYTFSISEAPAGTTNTALTASPIVTVVLLGMSKTASENPMEAGDTFTYTINYSNASGNPANSVYIWDTIPYELTFLNSSPGPYATTSTTSSGTFAYWYIGSVNSNANGSISIVTLVSPTAINMAFSITNTAFATSQDIQFAGVTLRSNPCITNVKGVTLTARIDGYPNPALPGQVITMNLIVNNTGYQVNATNVVPGGMGDSNSSLVTINSGPTPAYIPTLTAGSSYNFTWVFTTNSVGTVVFTDNASASEVDTNGTYTRTSNTYAFTFVIANATPTPTITRTQTPSPTFTATPSPTLVISRTYTGTNTPTFTPTFTPTPSFTATPSLTLVITDTFTMTQTNTPTLIVTYIDTGTNTPTMTPTLTESPTLTSTCTEVPSSTDTAIAMETFVLTATSTLTNQGTGNTATATPVVTATCVVSPVVTNTPTPNLNMTLSKNYVNPDKGEKLQINLKTQANVQVKIKVYNLTGEVVRNDLGFTASADGWNQVQWDVKNGDGKIAGEGLYFVYIEAGADKKLLKVYVIK